MRGAAPYAPGQGQVSDLAFSFTRWVCPRAIAPPAIEKSEHARWMGRVRRFNPRQRKFLLIQEPAILADQAAVEKLTFISSLARS
jgi:hypothetical protein